MTGLYHQFLICWANKNQVTYELVHRQPTNRALAKYTIFQTLLNLLVGCQHNNIKVTRHYYYYYSAVNLASQTWI